MVRNENRILQKQSRLDSLQTEKDSLDQMLKSSTRISFRDFVPRRKEFGCDLDLVFKLQFATTHPILNSSKSKSSAVRKKKAPHHLLFPLVFEWHHPYG